MRVAKSPSCHRVMTAFTIDAAVLERVRRLVDAARASDTAAERLGLSYLRRDFENLDALGLKPENYLELANDVLHLDKHVVLDASTIMKHLDDASRNEPAHGKWARDVFESTRRRNREARQKERATRSRAARPVNLSRVIEALLIIGMNHLGSEATNAGQIGGSTQSKSSAPGDAGKAKRKFADRRARKTNAAHPVDGRRGRAA